MRGKRQKTQQMNERNLEIYYNNVNGLISKQDSLKHILQMRNPDLVTLCETKLHKNSQFKLEGYEVRLSNLKAGKEGILIAAKEGSFSTMELIYESEQRNIATVEIAYPSDTVRIIVVHGPQEDDPLESREEFYEDFMAEVERCLASGCRLITAGDFNARLEHLNEKLIEAKGNGKLLKGVIDKYDLKVANFKPDTDGHWTRIQTKENIECKSMIDYIITDPDTEKLVSRTVVDEEKLYTPYRSKKEGKKKILVFTDHCSISTNIDIVKGSGKSERKQEKKKIWVIEEQGLSKFHQITSDDVGLGNMSQYNSPFDAWMEKVDHLMYQCFLKRTVKIGQNRQQKFSCKAKRLRDILKEAAKRGKIQREIIKQYQEKLLEMEARKDEVNRAKKLNETVNRLTTDDILSPNAFWKLRKSISKKDSTKLQAVYKREGGIATKEDEIKDEVKKEFEHRLRNRLPAPEWEGFVMATNEIVELLMAMDCESEPFSKEELDAAIKKLKTGTAPDYYDMHSEVLLYAGNGILEPLLQVFNIIRVTRKIPEKWQNVLITMIYKNKGSHLDLEKYRGIFLTVIVSKVFERLIKNRMKPNLDKISPFQAGSKDGKGPPDNLFILRSCIDHYKYMNKPLYITTYDFRQAFDSLWIQDCILALKRLGVENYLLQLIYELNKKTIVQVKTPYGLTEPAEITDIVKQGGILGSSICSATTAEICGVNKGISIGDIQIATLAYVDDLIGINENSYDTTVAHDNTKDFSRQKKLEYAGDKCKGMVVNGKKNDTFPELFIMEDKVEEVSVIECLGDVFNSKGNNEDLINDRIRRGTTSMISINGFIRETQLGIHTIAVHILLHNVIFIASILFNAQAWSNLTMKNINKLTTMQLKFLKQIMGVKKSTPNAFVYLEMGVMPVENEIHKRQLGFLHHIIHLKDDDPVRRLWKYLTTLPDYNNWWSGIKSLMSKYSVLMTEDEIKKMSKESFKENVKKAVRKVVFENLKEECKSKKQTGMLEYTEFRTQTYLHKLYPNHSRTIFKCRSKTLNIKEFMQYKYRDENHCRWCGISDETLKHIVNCGFNDENIEDIEEILHGTDLQKLKLVAQRIEDFLERVEV